MTEAMILLLAGIAILQLPFTIIWLAVELEYAPKFLKQRLRHRRVARAQEKRREAIERLWGLYQ